MRSSLTQHVAVLGVPLPWVLLLGLSSYVLTVSGRILLNVPLGIAAFGLGWAFRRDPLADLVFLRNKGKKLWVD